MTALMTTNITTDVIIVGAGPTGLSLALQLARHGVEFVIVDKNEGITPYSKALGIHARTLEIYEQMGLAAPAIAQGTIAGKVRMLEGGTVVGEVDLSHIGEGMSPYPYLLVLEQSENERLLYGHLRQLGREVSWRTEFQGLAQDDDGVTARVLNDNGESQLIKGKFLVGCDGPRSLVRHALGLSFVGSTFERLFYVADVQIDWAVSHDALNVCLAPHGVVAFFPMRGDRRWRIVGAFPEGHDKDEGEILYEEIEQRIKQEAELDLKISHVNWFSVYKVHSRHVEKFSSGRCFLAGDAAHIHTPAGGQGMNTGIQDAYNLAWKLALVLKGSAGQRLLETYNDERLPNARRLLQTTDRMFSLAAGSDWLLNVIRTTVFPPLARFILSLDVIKKKFFPLLSQIGIRYRESTLSDHEGDGPFVVKAGDRMPYFLVDGKSIYDQLRAPKFHLLTFTMGADDNARESSDVVSEYHEVIDHRTVSLSPLIAERFGRAEPFSVLLRPDNHIAFISTKAAADRLRAYFNLLVK
jgi:2-polyprenyl-6-methoxyphenol hydroxylase-like FAD-dependent oxidoreductase